MTVRKLGLLALALTLSSACDDGEMEGTDGGPGSDASVGIDGGGSGEDSGTTTIDSGGGGEDAGGCTPNIAIVCVGDDRTAQDSCTGASTVVETCADACYLGECVDCAPGAGRLCVGNEARDVDSCGAVGGVLETCAEDCRAGGCVGADCTPDADTICQGDTVWSVDSCGNLQNALRVCDDGCTDGACNGCTPDTYSTCFEGDIYSLDSCFALGAVQEDCAETCAFDGSTVECVTGRTCTPNDGHTCFLGNIHHVDSCGNVQEDIAQDCPSGCDTSGCLPCEPAPVGTTCADGDVHELIGGCDEPATAGDLLETCTEGCHEGACLTGGCTPNAGTVCSDGDVHSVDSCGTVGGLLEACTAGCERGACTTAVDAGPADGGVSDPDGGSSSSCTCVASDGYPPVDCSIGEIRCSGCLGYDDFCDDYEMCQAACLGEFTCSDGAVVLDGTPVVHCSSCPDCSNPSLCEAVCPAG